MVKIYDAFESLLKTALPKDCKIFAVNMPLQLMDQLSRETAKLATWLIVTDRVRVNTDGSSPVHEVTIEVSVYGTLDDVDAMAYDLNSVLVGQEVSSSGWRFVLVPGQTGKRDIWDPRIASKREHLQFRGFAIEPNA